MSIFLARSWINDAVQSEYSVDTRIAAAPITALPATRPVIVADLNLPFGHSLTPQDVRVVDMPEALIPEGVFVDFDTLFGPGAARTVVLTRMNANEPILDYKVSGPGGRGSLSALISEGMRAASIRVNAVAGVGGFVLPGDHVDIMLTRDQAADGEPRKLATSVLLQNVKVLGADQNADTQSQAAQVVQTVTLEVTPLQAQQLTLAMDVGSLSLSLRRTAEIALPAVTLVSEGNLSAAPKTAKSPAKALPRSFRKPVKAAPSQDKVVQVNIIRSGEREAVNVRKDSLAPALTDMTADQNASEWPRNDTGLAGAEKG